MSFGPRTRKNLAVLIPEAVFAPVATIGAVYCANKFAPHQMQSLTNFICKNIVEPHLTFFAPYEGSIQRAHEIYDKNKREEKIKRGEPVAEIVPAKKLTTHERALIISDVLANGAVAMPADLISTLCGQHFMNKSLKAGIPVTRTAITESIVHLGLMITLPRYAAGMGEDVHYGITKKLRKTFGISEERADEVAIPYTYVTLPGQIASLFSLLVAHSSSLSAGR